MDFQFTEREENFRQEIREFVKKNLPKDYYGNFLEEEHDDKSWEFAMSIAKKLAEKKWLTIAWPKEYGGMGASHMEQLIFKEEVGYWGIPGTTMGISGTGWVGPSLMIFGTKEQKEKYIPLIAAGDPDGVWCTGYSEPDSGSDLASLQTSAKREGDEYIINGQKVWTSAAHRARWLWLACKTDPTAKKKHHGISLVVVDMKSKGLTVRPLENLVGAHIFNELFFNDVRIPAENLVGVENKGWSQLMQALSFERGGAVTSCGVCKRILDELIIYTKETGLIKKSPIRQKLADIAVDIEAARILAYEADWKISKGMTVIYEPSRDKANCDVLFEKVSRIGTEIIGAYSQIDTLNSNNRWRKLKGMVQSLYFICMGMAIAAGTTDTQRNIVGQFGLHLPKAY